MSDIKTSFFDKAHYNSEFLEKIKQDFPNDFYDWKTTVVFYIAYHLIKGIAEIGMDDAGETHRDVFRWIKKPTHERGFSIPNNVLRAYSDIYDFSVSSRYDGVFRDPESEKEIQQQNFEDAERLLANIRSFAKSRCGKCKPIIKHAYLN